MSDDGDGDDDDGDDDDDDDNDDYDDDDDDGDDDDGDGGVPGAGTLSGFIYQTVFFAACSVQIHHRAQESCVR